MTLFELRKWLWDDALVDRWYAAVDGETLSEPFSLKALKELSAAHPQSRILVVHEGGLEKEPTPWLKLTEAPEDLETRHLSTLRKWLWDNSAEDRWWLAIDDQVLEHLVSLDGAALQQREHPGSRIFLMNSDKAHGGGESWVELNAL